VIADSNNRDALIPNAVAKTASTLSAGDPRAHVFYEERSDVRLSLDSAGLRELFETRTCGAAISGRHSLHGTDADLLDLDAESPSVGESLISRNWIDDLESVIVESGTAGSVGRRRPIWAAKLIAFRQLVWVGTRDGTVVSDDRRGCRIELRVQVGSTDRASAVEELVLLSDAPKSLMTCFSRAYDRAEERTAPMTIAPRGQTTAILGPGVGGIVVHELIGHALEGDIVARRPTWITRTGLPRAGRPLTVIDDPRRGRGAWKIDDEGTPSRETVLVEEGRHSGFLLDRPSATFLSRASTGHGRRFSYLEPVRPRTGCTYVAAGTDDPEGVLRSTPSGVFIRRLAGGHTDPFTGRASFVVTDADRIVAGHLAGPLDAFVLELRGPVAWASIDRTAHDLTFDTCVGSCVRDGQPLAVSVGAPTIRIGVVTVIS
jgi:predicted Zn-dependent protease